MPGRRRWAPLTSTCGGHHRSASGRGRPSDASRQAVPPRPATGSRRHERGVGGDRHDPRPAGRGQAAEGVVGRRPRRRRALPPGGHRRGRPQPPVHRQHLRHRRGVRAGRRRDGARARAVAAVAARRVGSPGHRRDARHRTGGGRRLVARPPGRPRAPRREAGQRARDAGGPGQADGLRHREGGRAAPRRPHGRERDDGHGQVPVAGAGARLPARRPGRPLLARPRALRVPDRQGGLHRRHRRGHRHRPAAARPGAHPEVPAGGAAGRRRRGGVPPGPPTRGPPGHRCRGPRHAGRRGQRARRRHPAAAAPAAVTARRRPSASRRPARRIRTSTTTSRPRGAGADWP